MKSINELEEKLNLYRNGDSELPGYDDLIELVIYCKEYNLSGYKNDFNINQSGGISIFTGS
jgi:hypothetical protein